MQNFLKPPPDQMFDTFLGANFLGTVLKLFKTKFLDIKRQEITLGSRKRRFMMGVGLSWISKDFQKFLGGFAGLVQSPTAQQCCKKRGTANHGNIGANFPCRYEFVGDRHEKRAPRTVLISSDISTIIFAMQCTIWLSCIKFILRHLNCLSQNLKCQT